MLTIIYNGGGFSQEKYNKFRIQIEAYEAEIKKRFNKPFVGGSLVASVLFIVPYLREVLIKPTTLCAILKTKEESDHVHQFLSTLNIELDFLVGQSDIAITEPFIVFSSNKSNPGTHVFFVPNIESFAELMKTHMPNKDDFIFAALSVQRNDYQVD